MKLTPQILAMYLGRECMIEANEGNKETVLKLMAVNITGYAFFDDSEYTEDPIAIEFVKPILRRLEDMAEEEALEFTKYLYGKMFGLADEIKDSISVLSDSADQIGWICSGHEKERIGITIEVDRGIELSLDGDKMKVNQFDCIALLLSKHFDLFGLIDSGEAIDQKTLKP